MIWVAHNYRFLSSVCYSSRKNSRTPGGSERIRGEGGAKTSAVESVRGSVFSSRVSVEMSLNTEGSWKCAKECPHVPPF